jgi:AcrR family transcriptional regulator
MTKFPVVEPSPTRELILNAAERLIGILGYSKTTVEDIARAAGVGKRTV